MQFAIDPFFQISMQPMDDKVAHFLYSSSQVENRAPVM